MRLGVTRVGFRFMALLAVVGFAAYNNQNNVLYLLLSVGIASVVSCLVFGWLSLNGLDASASPQPDAFADVAFRERLVIRNRSRSLPALGVAIDGASGAIPFVAAGESAVCEVSRLYRRRGLHPGAPVSLSTTFPFGFFRISRRVHIPRDLVIFPKVREIDPNLAGVSRGRDRESTARRGASDEFFGLRDYVAGDHLRHVHWKKSARVGNLVVREFGELEDHRMSVALVESLPEEGDPAELEHLLSAAASLVCHLVRAGTEFRFLSGEREFLPSSSSTHRRAILKYLATLVPDPDANATFEGNVRAAVERGERVILLAVDSFVAPSLGRAVTPASVLPELRTPA